MSKTRLLCHIVYATKHRRNTINPANRHKLIAYTKTIINKNKSTSIEINCVNNHIHLLIDIHPTVSVAGIVKVIKQSTSTWMHENPDFPQFEKWQEGYFAGSVGPDGVERCKKYIQNQEKHHLGKDYKSEMEKMVNLYGLEWYEDDWE